MSLYLEALDMPDGQVNGFNAAVTFVGSNAKMRISSLGEKYRNRRGWRVATASVSPAAWHPRNLSKIVVVYLFCERLVG